jgi:hypothetical protein
MSVEAGPDSAMAVTIELKAGWASGMHLCATSASLLARASWSRSMGY